jgi:hypothetical protein
VTHADAATCGDGSYSYSYGSGTCSWHGGVNRSYPYYPTPYSSMPYRYRPHVYRPYSYSYRPYSYRPYSYGYGGCAAERREVFELVVSFLHEGDSGGVV